MPSKQERLDKANKVVDKITYLSPKMHAYWRTSAGNYTAIRRRGYKGLLCWEIFSPHHNVHFASTRSVARYMLTDAGSYAL